jgi:hypothetical protein
MAIAAAKPKAADLLDMVMPLRESEPQFSANLTRPGLNDG